MNLNGMINYFLKFVTHCLFLQCLPWRVVQKRKLMQTFREESEFLMKIVPMICYTIIKEILFHLDSFLQLISPLFTKQCLVTKPPT